MLRSLLREPLVHFLLLGAALFALDASLRPAATPDRSAEIVVSGARIRNLTENFRRTWQRPPTRVELDGLVRDYVREEVLYREALALGLDRDDAIIRRRLRQKMEFVSEEAAAMATPTEQELADYLARHADVFGAEPRATFTQIYLDPQRRAKTLDADAKRLLAELNRGSDTVGPRKTADTLMLLDPRYENVSEADVVRTFGAEFAAALFRQPTGLWVGPIASGYGAHLVRIESLTPAGTPKLEEVRPLIEREWANAKRRELNEAAYEKLREKYAVTVRMPEATKQ